MLVFFNVLFDLLMQFSAGFLRRFRSRLKIKTFGGKTGKLEKFGKNLEDLKPECSSLSRFSGN